MNPSPPVAVVTGAASGIGAALARALAGSDTSLALLDRDSAGLRTTQDAVRELGAPRVASYVVDVSSREEVEGAFSEAANLFGRIDKVACAAGILRPAALDDVTSGDFDLHLKVNATGVLHCLQAASRHLGPGGAVVVISSNAARVPRTGMLAYVASKAAASAMARAAGLELASRGIRCNVVEPGSTDTPMQSALWADPEVGRRTALEGDPASYRVGIPLQRIADPEDVAAVAAFLLSDAARHVTMQQLHVDGGASL